MRDDAQPEETAQPEAEPAPPQRGRVWLVLALVSGLGLGIATGKFGVAPRIIALRTAEAARPEEKHPPALLTHSVENIVVNPAGTNGTRFLIVSVAIEVGSEEEQQQLRSREPAVRDVITGTLGRMSVAELARIDARDRIKAELKLAIPVAAGLHAISNVYLPQYVLQ